MVFPFNYWDQDLKPLRAKFLETQSIQDPTSKGDQMFNESPSIFGRLEGKRVVAV